MGPVLLGNNCTVREGARIYGPAILGDNTVVGKNVVIKRGILWNNVVVEDEAEVADAVVADHCVIPGGIMLKNEVLEKEELKSICEAALLRGNIQSDR